MEIPPSIFHISDSPETRECYHFHNMNPLQAGSCGKHAFKEARTEVEGSEDQRIDMSGKHLEVKLGPEPGRVSTSVCGVSPTDHRIGPPPLNDATHFSHE